MAKLKHLELPDGSNYDIYGVNVQEISYDDYEALTPTQKNSDIAYCITDTPYEVDDSIYGEASGAIASFSDGSANPLVKLEADINPIQDLHGYDKPWAGGAGKNKLVPSNAINTTLNGITFKTSGDGVYEISGTATAGTNCEFTFSQATSLVSGKKLSFFNNFTGYNLFFRKDGADKTYYNFSSANRTVTIAAADAVEFDTLRIMVESGATINGKFALMMYEGDTPTTYEPYANICPISGRSSVEVTVAGTNIWDEETERGSIDNTTGELITFQTLFRSKNKIHVVGGQTYYFASNYGCLVYQYRADDSYIKYTDNVGNVIKNFTVENDADYIRIRLFSNVSDPTLVKLSINSPSTDTSYHEYVGTTETISLGQTVYGGKLNVTTGELTIDRAMVDLGTVNWSYASNVQAFGSNQFTPSPLTNGRLVCTQYAWNSTPNVTPTNMSDGQISASPYFNRRTVMVKDSRYTDAATFKTAVSGVMLCYELETPITISLTPTQVSSLLGNNNIWADSGDVDVVYITSDFIYNELRMNDTVIASNSFAYHSIESESATMAGHANTASNAQTVNGHTVNSDVPSNATFTDTTYTFANGTNGFTVTPSGGTAQTVTVTPSITNNVTGSGTSGYLAKFNGANTITNGAQLGSDTTKFLRNDGTWAVPPGGGSGVTGVKGDAESTYRTGNVNLTPANLGLESKSAASGGTDLSLVTTGEKYTWDSKASSDEKVKQTPTSTDADYEILFSESASNLTKTEGARKYSNLKFNPSTGNLQTTKINGITLTSSPKFTDSKTRLTEDTGSWNTRTPYHMNTDAYSICMDSSSIDSGTPQSGVRGCDYSRRIAIHPNSSAISIGCCDGRYSRYLYDAIGFASVAISGGDDEESQYTTSGASGTASISVGTACHANANNTVAIGDHINANGKYEFSFGRYNVSGRSSLPIVDGDYDYDAEGTYVETVGNGTSSTRSNARTLDWSGNEWLAGTLTASGATINGSISVSDNILSDDSSLDITTSAPSSDYWSQYGIYFRDTNQTEFGRVRGYYLTDGEVGVEYETKRTVGGTVKYNNLNLGIDSSGNNVVSVSSPSAWRTALGLKDWVEVDHKGGTTAIPIPSGTTEICCVITVGNNTIAWTFTLPYAALSSTSWRYTNAYTSVSDGYIAVNVSTAQVSLNAVYNGKSNVTNSSILYLYAR